MPWKINNLTNYRSKARPKQLPPDTPGWLEMLYDAGELGDVSVYSQNGNTLDCLPEELTFFIWVITSGRGFGKSFTGAGFVNEKAKQGKSEFGMMVGRTSDDVKAYMIEGESGVLAVADNDFYPEWKKSDMCLRYPNGVTVNYRYAQEKEGIRGPNNGFGWGDEPASWPDAPLGIVRDTVMSNFLMTLRKGKPQVCMTGTPKPLKLIKELVSGERFKRTIHVRGSSYENEANLSKEWFDEIIKGYEGTSVAAQEVYGNILEENPDALWNRASDIDPFRATVIPDLDSVVVALDPAATSRMNSAETGTIVAGSKMIGDVKHYYVLADRTPPPVRPKAWANNAIRAYNDFNADCIVAESNNGGEMIEETINNCDESNSIPVRLVWASRGKVIRAEPVSALYEKGLVHHVGKLTELEDELCTWQPGMESPNRLDALVWAITHLMGAVKVESSKDAHTEFFGDPEGHGTMVDNHFDPIDGGNNNGIEFSF